MKEYIMQETEEQTTFGSVWRRYEPVKELVRCQECKHRPTQTEPGKSGFTLEFPDSKCPCQCEDGFYSWFPPDNWFCADGEKSE